jgi:hypothetical protein
MQQTVRGLAVGHEDGWEPGGVSSENGVRRSSDAQEFAVVGSIVYANRRSTKPLAYEPLAQAIKAGDRRLAQRTRTGGTGKAQSATLFRWTDTTQNSSLPDWARGTARSPAPARAGAKSS